jgi:hypothetical protein
MDVKVFSKARYVALAIVGATSLAVCGCGGSAASQSHESTSSSPTRSDWVDRANEICRTALPDGSHELVNHLDIAHIKRHGMAVVTAGASLDALGPPADTSAKSYADMLDLYKRSAIDHGLAVQEIQHGNTANAAAYYSIGLGLADKADAIAARLGATDCGRFGMGR